MKQPVICPNCEASFSVSVNLAGKRAKCRQCEQPFVLSFDATPNDDPVAARPVAASVAESAASDTRTIGCDRRYLMVRMLLEMVLPVAFGIAIAKATLFWWVGLLAFLPPALYVLFRWKCRTLYRFAFDGKQLHTRKIFTAHVDSSAPTRQVQSISTRIGPLQAILGCGTIVISTSSSASDDGSYIWPHLTGPDAIAARLRDLTAPI